MPGSNNSGRWRLSLDASYEILGGIRESRTAKDISRHVLAYARRFGATNLLAGTIPPRQASRREQMSHVLLNAWPQEWSCRYFSNGYLYRDPTIQLVSRGSEPFLWSGIGNLCTICPLARRVMDEAAEFQLCEGLTIAFSTVERRMGGFSIAGETLDPDPCEHLTFQLVAAYAIGWSIVLSKGDENDQPVHLSPRQYDVLRWASEGLTVNEIADRLNVSSNTADTHLRAVRERLGVTTTVHAVAKAFRIGLIN